ncbi:MAG: hypothetical protein KME28_07540 [Pelatocladus maniniholoensis HA4357-MV3]|uniref:Uncharacterized protein n=1 Tax=Pelatocladus maniniholoensis HA4357-MV3 TaxID=1117104 RepID=A0A9E3H7N6_9NOST|nr:hypothetical protein [Pelatocladus maniniholoensis HA4357-MV3]
MNWGIKGDKGDKREIVLAFLAYGIRLGNEELSHNNSRCETERSLGRSLKGF